MRYLQRKEREQALHYLVLAEQLARQSTCLRKKSAALIVKDDTIHGEGVNSPPARIPLTVCLKDTLPKDFKSDRTCCVHAEERAIVDALQRSPHNIQGSRLYFARINDQGKMITVGQPYCTICSKLALDVGIEEFVLNHDEGIAVYDTLTYNELSFQYRQP
ncbi:MAG: hypothetical protein Q7R56_03635 [Nanoarchaeota archaeon]|nr:hypothetical protein [Nanoarchaeota archaeon]